MSGSIDVPLSAWVHNLDRSLWMDFTFATVPTAIQVTQIEIQEIPYERFVSKIMGNFVRTDLDVTLFLRPFTVDAWLTIMVSTAILGALHLGLSYLAERDFTSLRLTAFVACFFFVLVNAFYGGALTMFFTSQPAPPFESIRQAMAAYPDYKLMFIKGIHYSG